MLLIHWKLILILPFIFIVFSCDWIDIGGFLMADSDVDNRYEWSLNQPSLTPVNVSSDTFSFLAITDTHYFKQTFPQPHFNKLRESVLSQDLFLVIDGDLMQSGSSTALNLCKSDIESVGLPYFPVLGNHDIYNQGWEGYRSAFGPSVYSLAMGQVRLICLDTANGTLGGKQYEWLKRQLKNATEPYRIVITHANFFAVGPLALQQLTDYEEEYAIMNLFEKYHVDLVLSGHAHYEDDRTIKGVRYLTMAPFHVTETPRKWYRITFSPTGIRVEDFRI